MKKVVFSIFLISFALFSADIKIPVQGFLADSEGVAINGNQNISFSLYNIDSGGDSIWNNQEAIAVEVKDGMFSQMLGEVDFINSELIENAAPLYLEVKVNDEVLLPRIELGIESKSAYSYNSAKLEGKTLSEVKAEASSDILARLEALEASKTALETKVASLESAKVTLETKVITLENKTSTLETKVVVLEDAKTLQATEINTLKEANTQRDAKILALEIRVNNLNVFSGNYNDLTNKPTTITSAQSTKIANNEGSISNLNLDIDLLRNHINTNGTDIINLKSRTQALEVKTASMSVSGDNVVFTGVNLQVVSGAGQTSAAVNGKGNLIIGYDEARDIDSNKSGSHNLIVGRGHNYSSYGGVALGFQNKISGIYSFVLGSDNTASGKYSSVSGGYQNIANMDYSSVSGGEKNIASGYSSSISSGFENIANGLRSSVSAGNKNTASGVYSSVSGGSENTASAWGSSVSGGDKNKAQSKYSTVSGGYNHATPTTDESYWMGGTYSSGH